MVKLLLLFPLLAFGLTDLDRQELVNKNILAPYNAGFESGKSNWTASGGTFSHVISGTNLMIGKGSATWDSSAAAQTWKSKLVTIPKGLYGASGVIQCITQTPSGTATHKFRVTDGTNLIGSVDLASLTSPVTQIVNFVFPSTGSIQLEFLSVAADEPLIAVDDCYIGAATNLMDVSQAEFYGSQFIAGTAGCAWTGTNSSAFNTFAADADCPTPVLKGYADTTVGKRPAISFPSLPPGRYLFKAQVTADFSAADLSCGLRIEDTTHSIADAAYRTAPAGSGGGSPIGRTIEGMFEYTTAQGATVFHLETNTSAGSGTCDLVANVSNSDFYISVYRFPLASEQAFRPDVGPSSWSGYFDSTCTSWSVTQTAYTADFSNEASCALVERKNRNFGTVTAMAGTLPGIVFTPTRTGFYEVCAYVDWAASTLAAVASFKLWDGTTSIAERDVQVPVAGHGGTVPICGLYEATSIASKTISIRGKASAGNAQITNLGGQSTIEWTVKALDFSMNAPVLVGGVTNSGTGAIRTEAAKLNCDAGSAVTSNLNGSSFVSTIGNISAGKCAVTFTTGVFSAAPYCTLADAKGAEDNGYLLSLLSPTSTSITIDCDQHEGTDCTSYDVNLICIGAR